jgi:hypothetical protein
VTLDQTQCARLAQRTGRTPDLLRGGIVDAGRLAIERGLERADYSGCMRERGYKRPAG